VGNVTLIKGKLADHAIPFQQDGNELRLAHGWSVKVGYDRTAYGDTYAVFRNGVCKYQTIAPGLVAAYLAEAGL
jgi:hypothetical protein